MQRFFYDIFAYYDLFLPIGSDEITKRLQMWLNNPQCGYKEKEKFPIFCEITIKASPPISTFRFFFISLKIIYYRYFFLLLFWEEIGQILPNVHLKGQNCP